LEHFPYTGVRAPAPHSTVSRIVGRVDEVNHERPDKLNLNDHLLVLRPDKMRLIGMYYSKRTRIAHLAFRFVEFIAEVA